MSLLIGGGPPLILFLKKEQLTSTHLAKNYKHKLAVVIDALPPIVLLSDGINWRLLTGEIYTGGQVEILPTSVEASVNSIGGFVGDKGKISAVVMPAGASQAVSFTSGDTSVITIDAQGNYAFVGIGPATVFISTPNSKRTSVSIEVYANQAFMTKGVVRGLDINAPMGDYENANRGITPVRAANLQAAGFNVARTWIETDSLTLVASDATFNARLAAWLPNWKKAVRDFGRVLISQGGSLEDQVAACTDATLVARYKARLKIIAETLAANFKPSEVCLELFNEPIGMDRVATIYSEWFPLWHGIVRKAFPLITVMIQPRGGYAGGGEIMNFNPALFDANTMFAFHPYMDGEVTHQGIKENRWLKNIPWPIKRTDGVYRYGGGKDESASKNKLIADNTAMINASPMTASEKTAEIQKITKYVNDSLYPWWQTMERWSDWLPAFLAKPGISPKQLIAGEFGVVSDHNYEDYGPSILDVETRANRIRLIMDQTRQYGIAGAVIHQMYGDFNVMRQINVGTPTDELIPEIVEAFMGTAPLPEGPVIFPFEAESGAELPAGTPAALNKAFTTVVDIGASNESYAALKQQGVASMARMKAKHGLGKPDGTPFDYVLKATAGDTQSGWKGHHYDALIPILTDGHIVYSGSLIGNDMTAAYNNRNSNGSVANAWAGDSADKALIAENKNILAAIAATGATVCQASQSFRNYGDRCVENEDAGARLFNLNGIHANIAGLNPSMMNGSDPYFDGYEFSKTLWSSGFADTRHLTQTFGYAPWRNWRMDNLAARLKGLPPVYFEKGFNRPRIPQSARIVCAPGNYSHEPIMPGMYNTSWFGSVALDKQELVTFDGYRLNSLTLTSPKQTASSNSATVNTGNTTDSLLNDLAKANCWYVDPAAGAKLLWLIEGGVPGSELEISVVSCRTVSAGTAARVAEFSVDGFATVALASNGAVPAGTEAIISKFIARFDSSGAIRVEWRCQAGSTFGYLNSALFRITGN